MDHIVYLDHHAKELLNLSLGKKTMIVRGSMGRKVPYHGVGKNDTLFFMENKGEPLIRAKGKVADVFFSDRLNREESFIILDKYQNKLLLNTALKKRYAGKRYITLISLMEFKLLDHPFEIDPSTFSTVEDWLIVQDIDLVRVKEEV